MQQFKTSFAGCATFVVISLAKNPVLNAQQYTAQAIGNFAPCAVNDSSQVVGMVSGDNGSWVDAVVYANGKLNQLLPLVISANVDATAISNSGAVAGWFNISFAAPQGFVWSPTQGFLNMAIPNGDSATFSSINNLGQVGGQLDDPSLPGPVAAVWTTPQTVSTLSYLGANDTASEVVAMNDADQAVGWSGFPAGATAAKQKAVLWQNGTVIDLTPNNTWSQATGINGQGQVIGDMVIQTTTHGVIPVPFTWDIIHGLVELPDMGDGGDAEAINNEGQIVGGIFENATEFAALWENGMLYNLNDLLPTDSGWVLNNATGINDSGDIIGNGTFDGQTEAFLLTPDGIISIPEPATIPLVAGFCLLARRRRQRIYRH